MGNGVPYEELTVAGGGDSAGGVVCIGSCPYYWHIPYTVIPFVCHPAGGGTCCKVTVHVKGNTAHCTMLLFLEGTLQLPES